MINALCQRPDSIISTASLILSSHFDVRSQVYNIADRLQLPSSQHCHCQSLDLMVSVDVGGKDERREQSKIGIFGPDI